MSFVALALVLPTPGFLKCFKMVLNRFLETWKYPALAKARSWVFRGFRGICKRIVCIFPSRIEINRLGYKVSTGTMKVLRHSEGHEPRVGTTTSQHNNMFNIETFRICCSFLVKLLPTDLQVHDPYDKWARRQKIGFRFLLPKICFSVIDGGSHVTQGGMPLEEFSTKTPPGWCKGLPNYPFRRYLQKLAVWGHMTDLDPSKSGAAILCH
jgi:hypothetical protein